MTLVVIFVTVSDCVDSDQTAQNVQSDLNLHCPTYCKEILLKDVMKVEFIDFQSLEYCLLLYIIEPKGYTHFDFHPFYS